MNAHSRFPTPEIQEWWTPAEWAEMNLVDLPGTTQGVTLVADRENWRRPDREYPRNRDGVWRKRDGRGGGFEYRINVLGISTLADLTVRLSKGFSNPRPHPGTKHADRWEWFDKLPTAKKDKARHKLQVLLAVETMECAGKPVDLAIEEVRRRFDVSMRTIYNWRKEVERVRRQDWLPHLAPRNIGSEKRADITPEAWDAYYAQYMRQDQPSHAESYRIVEKIAKKEGWTIPSAKTFERRIADLSEASRTLARKGPDALKRLYPSQDRDKTVFHALEAVNADGHKWDVFVQWEDGTIGRPITVAFQDVYSGKFVSWRTDRTENKDIIRLAFADIVEVHGVPTYGYIDNGRGFASKILTGGTAGRFRFKHKDEDPVGIFVDLGVEVHFATPYHGQAKPIERAFKDWSTQIAKDPRFAGAWTGNSVANKPENYGSKAVPIALFLAVLDERIADHNAQLGRRSKVCGGKLSFDQAFERSYVENPIGQASVAQKRMLLLASEVVTPRKPDGSVHVAGNRYWAEFLNDHIGKKVILRLDPQHLHDGVHVERADGAYLGFAECRDPVGFNDTNAARRHAQARAEFLRGKKMQQKAEQKMTIDQVAALMPTTLPPEPPEATVIRPLFRTVGATALKPETEFEHDGDNAAVPISLQAAIARMRPGQKNGADE